MSINGLLIFGENSNHPIRVKNITSLIFPTTPKEGMVNLLTLVEIGTFVRRTIDFDFDRAAGGKLGQLMIIFMSLYVIRVV